MKFDGLQISPMFPGMKLHVASSTTVNLIPNDTSRDTRRNIRTHKNDRRLRYELDHPTNVHTIPIIRKGRKIPPVGSWIDDPSDKIGWDLQGSGECVGEGRIVLNPSYEESDSGIIASGFMDDEAIEEVEYLRESIVIEKTGE
jgi:hypothetical protein